MDSTTPTETADPRAMPAVEPMPDNIRSIQPGGGAIQALERGWGRLRRKWLKTFRRGYVRRMQQRLRGDAASVPVEVIDGRDLKLYRNVSDCWFEPEDDRFAWRDRLPLARDGFAEIAVVGGACLVVAAALVTTVLASLAWVSPWWLAGAAPPIVLGLFVLFFFRDPRRGIPDEPGLVVSPADGKVVEIVELDDHEFIGQPAIKIAIFLSVFNVHVNRMSRAGKLIRLRYTPGKFLNAAHALATEDNERMELFFAEPSPPHRRFVVRQISGMVARRIVCGIRPGEVLAIGDRFGIIKFGSRTELVLPREGLEVDVKVGDMVHGGTSRLGRYDVES